MKYFVIDAFTDKPFGGNPAGVVLLGQGTQFPEDKLMQQIAAELRYSETAFVQQNGEAEFTVRYFTPLSEVDLCGHATIATFGLLRREGIITEGTMCLNHTRAGDLQVKVTDHVMMQMAEPQVIVPLLDVEYLHEIMAGRQAMEWTDMPIEVISTGLPDIIMPVGSVESLNALKPNMDALTELSRELNVVGVHAFAISDDGYTAHVRDFAPLYGVPEESATGTANAALTYYLYRRNIVKHDEECQFMQGEAMERPSVVATILGTDGISWVGGQCAVVASGELLV
ncbi:MAG: PhzF family phenazine biosynthesis protein [Muribaculaceae bacterium]|nr:PhzF family phenazine biosynthesis protein [Muribaculaceae bacterium]